MTSLSFTELLKRGELRVAVVGLGRIGLPTAVAFAQAGAKVAGLDIDAGAVASVNEGRCRFIDEPGLLEALKAAVASGRLKATLDPSEALRGSHVYVICVPTPVDENKVPDYSAIISAAENVGRYLSRGSLIAIESTVGPGDVEELIVPRLEASSGMEAGVDFHVASCPERADPGRVLECLRTVPRVVGGLTKRCTKLAAELYREVFKVEVVEVSSPKAANAVKITENVFRDVNIALMNELAMLYEKLGVDIFEVIRACSTKWNFVPHYPSAGVGGPCLPSNPYYLISRGLKVGFIPYLVRVAREINDRMPEQVATLALKALNAVGKTLKGGKVAILGLSYKPNVKDLQLSPSLRLVEILMEMGAQVSAYDPFFEGEPIPGRAGLRCPSSIEEALKGARCLIVATAHTSFKGLDLREASSLMERPPVVVDAVGLLDPNGLPTGIVYVGLGRALHLGWREA